MIIENLEGKEIVEVFQDTDPAEDQPNSIFLVFKDGTKVHIANPAVNQPLQFKFYDKDEELPLLGKNY